jgi:hypothetical protein
MKTFREHLNEEVKIGALASGGIDIERDAIRDEINGILASIAARPCVTPYSSLNKVRKALSYFSIFLPKRVYLEGRHGIEVWEVNQFGDKMGVTDQGEWIHHVPAKYYLFFHYHRMGGMYYLETKIVDEAELEKKINAAESMIAEGADSACRQDVAKHMAPKEPMHDVTSDEKKKGNKEAVSDSEKGLKEAKKIKVKLNPEKEVGYTVHDVGPGGKKTLVKSGKTKAKDIEEGWVAISRNGPVYDKFGDANPNAKFYGRKRPVNKPGDAEPGAGDTYKGSKQSGKVKTAKTVKEEKNDLKGTCWKGYTAKGLKKKGDRMVPNCVPVKEEQIDELSYETVARYHRKAAERFHTGEEPEEKRKKGREMATRKRAGGMMGIPKAKVMAKEETISEKAPPGAKFERMVKHIKAGYAKDGLTKKEKGIAYATAWKAKKRESED